MRAGTYLCSLVCAIAGCLAAASPQSEPKDPATFLKTRGVPDEMTERLMNAKRSVSEATLVDGGATLIGSAKQTFRSARMIRSARVAAPLRAKSAVLRLAWTRTFPRYRHPDILIKAVTRSKSGLAVRGVLRRPRSVMLSTNNAVYCVVRVDLKGAELKDCFPPAESVESIYLAELLATARSLEFADKGRSAVPFINEHERFGVVPDEFLPVVALCRLASGQPNEARELASMIWDSEPSGGAGFWFDMATLEDRLKRVELSDRAWSKAVAAYNEENWGR